MKLLSSVGDGIQILSRGLCQHLYVVLGVADIMVRNMDLNPLPRPVLTVAGVRTGRQSAGGGGGGGHRKIWKRDLP